MIFGGGPVSYPRSVIDQKFASLNVSGDYVPLSGGTIDGNLTVTGTLSTTLLEALSANITVIDIKQYELSGFNVTGNATVQGSISATGNLTISTDKLFVDSVNNRVGIGTATPSAALHIQGTMGSGADGNDATGIRLTNSPNGLTWKIASGIGGVSHANFFIGRTGTLTPDISIIGSSSFGTVGNVGIGTATAPAKLSIVDTTLAGSGALSGSALQINQTWNTTGTPTAVKLDVTDTASNAASLLMDLQVGGFSRFSVSKNAVVNSNAGYSVFGVTPNNAVSSGIGWDNSNHLVLFHNSTPRMVVISTGTTIASNASYSWSSSTTPTNSTRDLSLFRDAANTLAQRNGTNAQIFRLYNTYSSSTNFERLNFRWSGNTSYIGTEKGSAGGTARDLVLETDGTERVRVGSAGGFTFGADVGGTNLDFPQGVNFRYGTTNRLRVRSATVEVTANTASTSTITGAFTVIGGVGIGGAVYVGSTITAIGDVEITDSTKGIILKSPDGTRWRVTVDNTGALITTAVV